MDICGWDERYRSEGAKDATPTPLLAETAAKLKPARALDLACGTGRNAVWLAEHGWNVTAVDGAPAAIDTLRERCPAIDARIADLEKHEFVIEESAWDLIADCYYLQRDLFEPIKRGLKPGGVAVVIVHLVEPRHEESRFSVQPGELAKYFEGWQILHSYEGKPKDPEHKRAVAQIVARKP
ncbi:MAG: Methyltransferase type 12 [Bryobacterales bacterium]|jgi:tellurite methyltransferase|nr:Methyltransferase type 12 [Bryobacterales bacterium]